MNEVLGNIKTRRSIRTYQDKEISGRVINEIIDAGIWAPSATNKQAWRFVVVTNKDIIKKLSNIIIEESKKDEPDWKFRDKEDPVFYSAPLLIVMLAKAGDNWAYSDAALACQNMMLYSNSIDIGSCFVGFARFLKKNKEARKILGMNEGDEIVASVVFGYKAENPKPKPRLKPSVRFVV